MMKSLELHKQIEELIEKLSASNSKLSKHLGEYSIAETDEFRNNALTLYDTIHRLQMANYMENIQASKNIALDLKDIEIAEEPTLPEIVVPAKEPETTIIPVQIQNFDAPKFEPIIEKPIPVANIPKNTEPIEKSILDAMIETTAKASLHEIIASTSEADEWSHRFANSKINKIKDAIDISKRFEIQSNLFGGNANAYTTFIQAIESADGLESALNQFRAIAIQHHWNAETELVMELKSFIYRKY